MARTRAEKPRMFVRRAPLHARSADSPFPARPFLRDQFTMPAQDGVRCHKGRDVAKRSSADLVSGHTEPPALIIGQSNATAAQLRLQGPILFAEEVDDIRLLSLEPSKERHEQKMECEHASESIRIEVRRSFRT